MAHRSTLGAVVLALLLALAGAQPSVQPLTPTSVEWSAADQRWVVAFVLNVTLQVAAPNCFQRPVVLINGIFQPTIEVAQGDIYKVTLINNIPANYPTTSSGFSIHYHGLHMRAPGANWLDGVSYVELCPVTPGTIFEYQFAVDDNPGSYLWHDHSAGFKGDGMAGAYIVRPPRAKPAAGAPPPAPGTPPPPPQADLWQYDAEAVLFLSDWYNSPANSLMMRLNMPFDAAMVTSDSGAWNWIGNPQSILINGKGFYGDCPLFPGLGGNAVPPVCAPTSYTVPPGRSVQQPWASANNPGCGHHLVSVEAGKTYRLRLVSSAQLVYMVVCFEGHNVTVIAADGVPVEPFQSTCVDVNSGNRLDVLLTANQPAANYWITVVPQFRVGSPSGFAVLSYAGQNATFPTTAPLQGANVTAWTFDQYAKLVLYQPLVSGASQVANPALQYYLQGKPSLAPPKTPAKTVTLNISQPLLPNGIIRWALDNVVSARTPPCEPLMSQLNKDPRYLTKAAANASYNGSGGYLNTMYGGSNGAVVYDLDVTPVPIYPAVGMHVVQIKSKMIVDVIVNNRPGNSYNGDYRPVGVNRTAMEQHPFHLHGHHFWVLGVGAGVYDPATNASSLNTKNPPLKDVVTVPNGGWAVLRFVADNPGVWPFHCHIMAHQFMGQQVYFVEQASKIGPPPTGTPSCPATCRYNFAPYPKPWLRDYYADSGFELPPLY